MDRADLAVETDRVCRLTGTFTLRSGQAATEYFDKYRFEARPALLRAVAEAMVPLLPPSTEVVVCAIDRSGLADGPLADVGVETRAVLTKDDLDAARTPR